MAFRNLNLAAMAIIFFFFSTFAQADGNRLLEQCLSAERFLDTKNVQSPFNVGVCMGMVQGVRNTMQLMGSSSSIVCFPEGGIDNGQAIRIVTSFLRDNPAKLHYPETLLAMTAFQEAYPCE
ncbi:Rap1a/Tai family immunity protein [Marinobacter fonticola]|uniref:Rap1a/Tai family immunity protein n=1 Tax=Marinobacter fonticola TaxID=2603215 RepID=UPI0011E6D9FE|nr:Rap1a/Tai family immunity protein [Marinobacter fonticola]